MSVTSRRRGCLLVCPRLREKACNSVHFFPLSALFSLQFVMTDATPGPSQPSGGAGGRTRRPTSGKGSGPGRARKKKLSSFKEKGELIVKLECGMVLFIRRRPK